VGRDCNTVTAVQRQRSECKYRGGLHCVMSRLLERERVREEMDGSGVRLPVDNQVEEQILEYFDWAFLETGG
jgi:hypothetical protein